MVKHEVFSYLYFYVAWSNALWRLLCRLAYV